jgi:hypothetical protein
MVGKFAFQYLQDQELVYLDLWLQFSLKQLCNTSQIL